MLSSIELRNFRCFDEHAITFRPFTLIVGQNNAGKSTLAEALRLLSLVTSRYRALSFGRAPAWTPFGRRVLGVSPSTKGLELNFPTVFHRYGDPPAEIRATFSTGADIQLLVGPDSALFALISDTSGARVTSRAQAQHIDIPSIAILPQVTALQKEEEVLTPDYIRSSVGSHLASLHFRNQLNLFYGSFPAFKLMAERTWRHLRILDLEGRGTLPKEGNLSLLVQDGNFAAEIGWMGHGLQMWLQMIWFLARSTQATTLILDEPDVYLHADLQRRLIRLIRGMSPQTIVTTHSIEIIAEVEPEEILIVDKKSARSRYAASLPVVQRVVDSIGGVHNLQLTRLWSARRCLLLEGNDLSVLRRLHKTLYPQAEEALDALPHMSIGGWGGWSYAVGSTMFLKNAGGARIQVYCILDRDYHWDDEIHERADEAHGKGINLHVWSRKEIENFLLVPSAIVRAIQARGKREPSVSEIATEIQRIVASRKEEVLDGLADTYLVRHRSEGLPGANRAARELVESRWATHEGRLTLVSGKGVLAELSALCQERYGSGFSVERVAGALVESEVAPELRGVIDAIESSGPYQGMDKYRSIEHVMT